MCTDTGLLVCRNQVSDDSVVCVLAALHSHGVFSGAACFVFQSCNPLFNLLVLLDRVQNLVLIQYCI